MPLSISLRDQPDDGFVGLIPLQLAQAAEKDYLTMRSLYFLGSSFFIEKITHAAGECLEKVMKAFLLNEKAIAHKDLISDLSHNLEKIRKKCATIDGRMDDELLQKFCSEYSKGHNVGNILLRYGMDGRVSGFGLNVAKLVPLIDSSFISIFIKLGPMFYGTGSLASIFSDVTNSPFPLFRRPGENYHLLQQIISHQNESLPIFLKKVAEFHASIQPGKEEA